MKDDTVERQCCFERSRKEPIRGEQMTNQVEWSNLGQPMLSQFMKHASPNSMTGMREIIDALAVAKAGNIKAFLFTAVVLLLVMVTVIGAPPAPSISIPPPAEILSQLRREHPRLLASASDFDRLKQNIATDPQLKAWDADLRREAERLLTQPASKYEIPDGLRLLSVSRRVLHRTQLLALRYRLDGDVRWLNRAWKEFEAAANFPDWNPRHFLDTAEMTHAFAIGYDWLFDALPPSHRAAMRNAMVEFGLKPALAIHRQKTGWTRARHNWNQVCNGGIGMGALALADEDPLLAGELLHDACVSIQLPMAEFAPDGAWAEGPGYWDYATTYNAAFLAALESALGTDFGLSQIPGFADAGSFPIYLTGPLNRTFNYADGGDGAIRAPHLFWLARKFHHPGYAAYQRRLASPEPLDLLWYDPKLAPAPGTAPGPLDKHFRGADIVTLRSAWNDPQALFAGFKAGNNKANHSHLDLGSFVLDGLGKRWAIDLGAEDYNLPGYFGKSRWTYYRLRAEGQNTLVLNPGVEPDQDPSAAARIERFQSNPGSAYAIADLTPAYAKHAQSVRRGLALLDRQRFLVQDEVRAAAPVDAWWFMHTPAEIRLSADGRTAILQQGGVILRADLLSPAQARFEIRPAAPLPRSPNPERQNRNEGIRKLTIHPASAPELRISVLLTPQKADRVELQAPDLRSLSEW